MFSSLVQIIDTLDHTNSDSRAFWTDVLASCAVGKSLEALHKLNELETGGVDADTGLKPFCALYKAYIHHFRGEETEAADCARDAVEFFRVYDQGDDYNEAVARWFQGVLYLEQGDTQQGRHELEAASEEFLLIAEVAKIEEYEKQIRCQHNSKQAKVDLNIPPRKKAPAKNPKPAQHEPEPPEEPEGLLAIPWLPILDSVQAGLDGPEWFTPQRPDYVELPYIFINDMAYRMKPLKGSGRRVTLQKGRDYAWAPVNGASMNKAKPVPILEKDYVLFESSSGPSARPPEDQDIIIVARQGTAGYEYLVKRYWKAEKLAVSETSRSGPEYVPLALSEDTRIIGLVLAVAKPRHLVDLAGTQASPSNPAGSPPSPSRTNKIGELYWTLLQKTGNDEVLAQRLVAHELMQAPGIKNQDAILRAIEHFKPVKH